MHVYRPTRFVVRYYWRGEVHRVLEQYHSIKDAVQAIDTLRKAGWQAWLERA